MAQIDCFLGHFHIGLTCCCSTCVNILWAYPSCSKYVHRLNTSKPRFTPCSRLYMRNWLLWGCLTTSSDSHVPQVGSVLLKPGEWFAFSNKRSQRSELNTVKTRPMTRHIYKPYRPIRRALIGARPVWPNVEVPFHLLKNSVLFSSG